MSLKKTPSYNKTTYVLLRKCSLMFQLQAAREVLTY